MGRIFDTLVVGKRRFYTLFDTGAKHSFVSREAARAGKRTEVRGRILVAIGGRRHRIAQVCVIEGTLRKKPVFLQAFVLPEIGDDADGRAIDVIFGVRAMQDFGIRLDPAEECVDMGSYRSTFVEF